MLSFSTDTAPQSFCHSFIPTVDDMLFEVGPEIRCWGVSSRYCCYGNHTQLVLSLFKNFLSYSQWRIE